jgi:hypothetical protein
MTHADATHASSFAEHDKNADVTRRMTNLCRAYFFGDGKPFHLPGYRRRLKRDLVTILRDEVVFPQTLIHVMQRFGDAAINAGRALDWSVAEYYNDNEKDAMLGHLRTRAYGALADRGDYRMPNLVYMPLAPDFKNRATEGNYFMVGNIVALSPELREGSLEKMITVATHEDGHALVHQFRRNCFGPNYAELSENTGMEWRRLLCAANADLSAPFYDACPEEALVRHMAAHIIDQMAENRDEMTRCAKSETDGYANHAAGRQLVRAWATP